MRSAAGHRVYEDFVPSHELVREETAGTLTIDLPGYKKEQIKVQIDKNGKLKISGERPLDEDNRWSRFRREFQVPDNCNVSDIRAKFENGHLHVILPKLTTEVKGQEKPTQAPKKPEESREPATEPKPSTGRQDDVNQKAPVKPNGGATKKQEDEKRGEPMDARKDEQKAVEKVKDQTEEKKFNEKVTGVVKREEGEKGDAVTDVQKKEAVPEPAAAGNGGNGEAKLKQKLDELGLGCYDSRQITASAIMAALVLVGMGLYVSYKLSTMEEDGN